MIKTIWLPALAATAVLSGSAMAQTTYGNVGYQALSGDDVTLGSIVGRVGFDLSDYFGLEAEASFGVVDDEVTIGATDIDVSADFGFGGFLVGRLPLDNGSSLFARVGYASVTIEGEAGGITASEDLDGFAYGIGGNFIFDGANGVRLDYTRLDGDGGDGDAYSIAYVRRF